MIKRFSFFKDSYFILPALSASLLAISRYPFKLNFLVFFAFIPLLYLLENSCRGYQSASRRKIIKAALTFSTTYTLIALYWIAVVTIPGYIGLFILFGFYFCVLFFIIFKVATSFPKLGWLILISSWLSFEWVQNFGELRFPWFNAGYALAEYTYLIQIAEYGGIHLLSLLILTINVLLFLAFKAFPGRQFIGKIILPIVFLVIWISAGYYRYQSIELDEKDVSISIVQVSIPQYIKWTENFYDSTLALYQNYTLAAVAESSPDLIIWPEAAIPRCVLNSRSAISFIFETVREADSDIFLGFPHCEYSEKIDDYLFYNSATLFKKQGKIAPIYYKNILVPVGERMPFMDYIPFLRGLDFGQANWEYGHEPAYYLLEKDDQRFIYSPLICFEIAFPNYTAEMSKNEVDFFVNITNDAWFKRTVGPYQHGMMTVIRAVETRTQFYRAANTGISMIVDPRGEIRKKTALFDKTFIEYNLLTYSGRSLFTRWWVNYPLLLLILTACLIIAAYLSIFSIKKP